MTNYEHLTKKHNDAPFLAVASNNSADVGCERQSCRVENVPHFFCCRLEITENISENVSTEQGKKTINKNIVKVNAQIPIESYSICERVTFKYSFFELEVYKS